jgi:uncharacterized protein
MYHRGHRDLQARFGSTALADRLVDKTHRVRLTAADRAFVEAQSFFFLATADGEGHPDCSFKGGAVTVLADDLLVFPDFDGNGMFRSLGNIVVNPHVGLLFIAFGATPKRLRINGRAELRLDDPAMDRFPGAQGLVFVTPEHVFPNCPRYVPDLARGTPSPYLPQPDAPPLEPAWKRADDFRDVVPPRKR